MDKTTLEREARYRDFSSLPRHFPSGLPVRAVGYLPAKTNRTTRTFDRLSFMFALRGAGVYRRDGEEWQARGPCVLLGYPGDRVDYGPYTAWEICYVNYEAALLPAFEARRLAVRARPVWPVHDAAALQQGAVKLLQALQGDDFGVADRIDRLCETLILESLISAALPPLSGDDRAINAARAYFERHFREPLDLAAVAEAHGFSASSFRRKWAVRMGMPPGEYISRLRIREAARLLVSSRGSIKEIAAAAGFEDPQYFARRFRQTMGESASDYRNGHEMA